jgi:malate dehydrogenase (oxaloacetate-decarboxylating)
MTVCDLGGALYRGRDDLDDERAALAERTNPDAERGGADDVLAGADVSIGVSGPGAISAAAVRTMAPVAIVLAMANPVPEVQPEAIANEVATVATGRSDYPHRINNVLAFPGIFRGVLDVRATTVNEEMKLAAAQAIAAVISDDELDAECIIPSAFNRAVAPRSRPRWAMSPCGPASRGGRPPGRWRPRASGRTSRDWRPDAARRLRARSPCGSAAARADVQPAPCSP